MTCQPIFVNTTKDDRLQSGIGTKTIESGYFVLYLETKKREHHLLYFLPNQYLNVVTKHISTCTD